MADVDEDDLSLLDYARLNGLCRDHFAPLLPSLCPEPWHPEANDSRLPQFKFSTNISTDERLSLTKEAARLLASIAQDDSSDLPDVFDIPIFDGGEIRKLKIELPLLRSDHETDCLQFARRSGFKEARLEDIKFPLEAVDELNNEGLSFPERLWNIGPELMEKLAKEKMEVTREAMEVLQATVKYTLTEEEEKAVWDSCPTYKRTAAIEPITPPLSPMTPPPSSPYEPSLSACDVPLLSSPVTPISSKIEAVEEKIFKEDVPNPIRHHIPSFEQNELSYLAGDEIYIKMGDVYPPLASLDDNKTSSPHVSRLKHEDLKVEVPLTPLTHIAPPKSVRFSDTIEEMLLAPESSPSSITLEHQEDTFFKEAFGPGATVANRQLEQEQPVIADSTARVGVPITDLSIPDAPWEELADQKDPVALLLMQKKLIKEATRDISLWPVSRHLHDKLLWTPFPHDLAKVALEEPVTDDDSAVEVFLQRAGDDQVITSSDLVWKPPGLRVLQFDDEDDEEIERDEAHVSRSHEEGPQDVSSLLRKRKMEIEERDALQSEESVRDNLRHSASNFPPHNSRNSGLGISRPDNLIASAQKSKPELGNNKGLLLGGTFSAGDSLDQFLELRGAKKAKLTNCSYFESPPVEPQRQVKSHHNVPSELEQRIELPLRVSPRAIAPPLPVPSINPPQEGLVEVIVSTILLKHRTLIKQLDALIPSLVLIERDFAAYNTTMWMPNSISRSPIASPLEHEADVIISPTAGVILTTIQKIKQKPLPGQKKKVPILDRLEKVSLRYEKVIVLVSDRQSDGHTTGLDDNDSIAFSELLGFANGLSTSVIVQFVGGGEENLAKWLASSVIQHHLPGQGEVPQLLQDETYWELFLRRAGMNAFAAQAVITALKAPEGVDTSSPSKVGQFGLTAFVEMPPQARSSRFGGICGMRVMARVNAVLDGRWE